MSVVKVLLSGLLHFVSIVSLLVALATRRWALKVHGPKPLASPTPPPPPPQTRSEEVSLLGGPADGESFPIALVDPVEGVPFAGPEGVSWYYPHYHPTTRVPVLRWDGRPPQPIS